MRIWAVIGDLLEPTDECIRVVGQQILKQIRQEQLGSSLRAVRGA